MRIPPAQLRDIFKHHPLNDIFVTGYIDTGSSLPERAKPAHHFGQFHPMWDEVYLEVGQTLLRLKTIESYSRVQIEQVARIECSFDIDPDDTFGVMSVLRPLLASGRESAQIKQLDVYASPDDQPETGIAAALGMVVNQGEYLFFDPQDAVNGIHIGSEQSRDLWLAWVGNRYPLKSYPVKMP